MHTVTLLTHTHTHTHTHVLTHTRMYSHIHTHSHPHSLTHSHTHTHTFTHSHPHPHTHSHMHTPQAIFEVVTSEEEHLAAMETLRKHYMQDSGLDPSLPKEQRVLSEEEYDDIFRYVDNVHHISAGYVHCIYMHVHACTCTCINWRYIHVHVHADFSADY